MAGVVAEAVVGSIFIEIVQGGEVEDLADDVVEVFFLFDEDHPVVDHLCGDMADDVDALGRATPDCGWDESPRVGARRLPRRFPNYGEGALYTLPLQPRLLVVS